jgi:hypothetical protein
MPEVKEDVMAESVLRLAHLIAVRIRLAQAATPGKIDSVICFFDDMN